MSAWCVSIHVLAHEDDGGAYTGAALALNSFLSFYIVPHSKQF